MDGGGVPIVGSPGKRLICRKQIMISVRQITTRELTEVRHCENTPGCQELWWVPTVIQIGNSGRRTALRSKDGEVVVSLLAPVADVVGEWKWFLGNVCQCERRGDTTRNWAGNW